MTGPDYGTNERTGKCLNCRIRMVWDGRKAVKLRNAACPFCGHALEATTHILRWPVKDARPLWYMNTRASRLRAQHRNRTEA